MAAFIISFPIVGGIEELSKFAVLYLFCRTWNDFDEPMDGLVYGVCASLGFAAIENWSYVYQSGLETALWRAVSAVPFHAMAGVIMGYYFGLAHFVPNKRRYYYILALAVPILLHGAYDYPLILQEILLAEDQSNGWLGMMVLPVLALETGLALALARRVRAAQAAGHHEAAHAPDYDHLHQPYQNWCSRRYLAGPGFAHGWRCFDMVDRDRTRCHGKRSLFTLARQSNDKCDSHRSTPGAAASRTTWCRHDHRY